MILFRAVYTRDKLTRSIIYPALDEQVARQYAAAWVARAKPYWKDAQLISVVPFRRGLTARAEDLEARQLALSL